MKYIPSDLAPHERGMLWFAGIVIALCIIMLFTISLAAAHEQSWVSKGALKNGAGEWCCGDYDCHTYQSTQTTSQGWIVDNKDVKDKKAGWANVPDTELIPYDEAMPTAPPDGQLAVCRRPDGSRRCIFGLKPGI